MEHRCQHAGSFCFGENCSFSLKTWGSSSLTSQRWKWPCRRASKEGPWPPVEGGGRSQEAEARGLELGREAEGELQWEVRGTAGGPSTQAQPPPTDARSATGLATSQGSCVAVRARTPATPAFLSSGEIIAVVTTCSWRSGGGRQWQGTGKRAPGDLFVPRRQAGGGTTCEQRLRASLTHQILPSKCKVKDKMIKNLKMVTVNLKRGALLGTDTRLVLLRICLWDRWMMRPQGGDRRDSLLHQIHQALDQLGGHRHQRPGDLRPSLPVGWQEVGEDQTGHGF